MTDAQLLEKFKQMHPTYTARTLQKVLLVSLSQSFLLLQKQKLTPAQRRLLGIYFDIPAFYRHLYFPT